MQLQDDYSKQSNADVVASLRKEFERKELTSNGFPTELLELPSRGLIYPKDNPLSVGKLELKYPTAKDENILTTPSYIKDNSVIDRFLKSIIVGNSEGKPINYDDLVIGDKNAIMIAARILAYGKNYEVEMVDPFSEDNTAQTYVIDLTQFENLPYDGSKQTKEHTNEFIITLSASNRTVTFSVMTVGVDKKVKNVLDGIERKRKKEKNRISNVDETSLELTTRLKYMITSVDGDTDRSTIDTFVDEELLSIDSRELRGYISSVAPDVDLSFDFISKETGESTEMSLPMTAGFFWPKA